MRLKKITIPHSNTLSIIVVLIQFKETDRELFTLQNVEKINKHLLQQAINLNFKLTNQQSTTANETTYPPVNEADYRHTLFIPLYALSPNSITAFLQY